MKNKTIETVVSTSLFALLNIAYLLFHFSVWGLIPLLLTLTYYVFRIHAGYDEDAPLSFSDWIGAYLGALFVDMFFIKACATGFSNWINGFRFSWPVILPLLCVIAAFIVLFNLNRTRNRAKPFVFILRYVVLLGATVGISFFRIEWFGLKNLFALLPLTALALIIDLSTARQDFKQGRIFFNWTLILFLLFALTSFLYPDAAIEMADWILHFSLRADIQWYVLLGTAVVFFGGFVATLLMRQKSRSGPADSKLYLFLCFTVLFFWILPSVRTVYSYLFVIFYGTVNAVCLPLTLKDYDYEISPFGFRMRHANIQYAAVLAVVTGLPVAFFYGFLLPYAVLAAAGVFVLLQYGFTKARKDPSRGYALLTPDTKFWFWETVLIVLGVYAAVVVTEKTRFLGSYILIGAVLLLATLALCAVHIQRFYRSRARFALLNAAVVLPVCLILVFGVSRAPVRVSYATDDAVSRAEHLEAGLVGENPDIRVRLTADDGVVIRKAFCYWSADKEAVLELDGTGEETVIPGRGEWLHVVCETDNGVLIRDSRWFTGGDSVPAEPAGIPRVE